MSKYPTNWNLSRYFYANIDDPQMQKDFEEVETMIKNFVSTFKGKLTTLEPTGFLEFFAKEAEIDKLANKIMSFVFYLSSLDTQNQAILKKESELNTKMTDLGNLLLFVDQEFKERGYQSLVELGDQPELSVHQNYFVKRANSIKYLLDEKTESALNLKEISGPTAMFNLFEEFSGNLVFPIEIEGEEKILTQEEVRSLRSDPKEATRKKAFESIQKVYNQKSNQIVLSNIYKAIVKDWTSELKIRGFNTVLSQRNLSEQMPDKAVDMLFESVTARFDLYQRYLKAKLILLKKNGQQKEDSEKLKSWNVFAPVTNTHKTYPFEESATLYFETMGKFDPEMRDIALDILSEERVDVYPKMGKRSGAYASYDKDSPSFILLNYTSQLRDVATLAHEMGHAVHGVLSQKQSHSVYNTGLCLAETASVFGETIFSGEFLKTLETEEEKLEFLNQRLDDIFGTIFRQIMYASFEKEVHENINSGKDLSYLDLNKIWRKWQQKFSGDLVEYQTLAEEEATWSGIPHFYHTPFYVYSYAFGNILSFSLYEIYKEKGQQFVPIYKEILASGGSKSPFDLLLKEGLDITKPEFYQKGLLVVEETLEEFEKLVGQI